ncbi:MAG TPA: bifunctional glycosyltransferase family 2/GtrA family protein [Acidobacteriota bacterium]|nr:glycosyltransferase [Acidobacteriota bacterium]HOT00850.1 bifunctional glycosyltransferase family 2/GtrA family protein [Acidobacteriota bacterium]HQF88642.1 bifunctional glycosyltransferase family 2/GtrA family protein [Acidobacteriota bacterium]HQG91540.1 bifunctional glycosyltransferase family 2/GtrA family protein [Acidobacteriota bacterium]HQK86080.1 bifunctional glycosyltransferase family 2/GtrA family protein [Acidobacteriota bacterium]
MNGLPSSAMPPPPLVLIPAYRPDNRFADLVAGLSHRPEIAGVIIVDDGSGPEFAATFAAAIGLPNVRLLRHAVNRGKGAAIKTGLNEIMLHHPDVPGVVTADADGQHRPEDIVRVASALSSRPDTLVLGCRDFSGDIPWRSRIGNRLTRRLLRWIEGLSVSDTQTGLRGIPAGLIPALLAIPAERYEYELEMLLTAHRLRRNILEIPVATVYLERNVSSHFNPLTDSMRIYFVLFRYLIVSLLTALVDNAVFAATFLIHPGILAAMVAGRVVAGLFNYFMNRSAVFMSRAAIRQSMPRYILLVVFSGSIGYALIRTAVDMGLCGAIMAKLAVESVLFVFNFAVQKVFVFPPPAETPPDRG